MAINVPKKRIRASDRGGECSSSTNSKRIVAASEFMSVVSDDLLVEILLRLPNARSVLQCAAVCKLWYSLILSPEFSFRRRFIEYHHLLKPSLDSSYLFKFSVSKTRPFYLLSSESKSKPNLYGLSFIPNSTKLAIRASSGDLMLLSEGDRRYYICNSLTNRWFLLPEIPLEGGFAGPFSPFEGAPGFALVRDPTNTNEQLHVRYRVVVICWTDFVFNKFRCAAAIFDSETGHWTQSYVAFPYPCLPDTSSASVDPDLAIAGNGVLYWLDGDYGNYHGMASLDPSTVKLRLIPLPAGQFQGIRGAKFKHKVRTGVVRGRVRVSRMVESESMDRFSLRVWELDCGDERWELVHEVDLEAAFLFVLAFDPYDGDAIFVVRDWEIFRYEIGQEKFVKICRFPRDGILSQRKLKKRICRYFKVLTLVHPLWPTSMNEIL